MARKYWLDLFTGKTWEEFLEHGGAVSGFREHRKKMALRISPGDYLICYLTGISRIVGILEVTSKCYDDSSEIWKGEVFPVRFKVKILHRLEPEYSVPILDLRDKLSLFKKIGSKRQWSGFFRGSPAEFQREDGEVILEAVESALASPIVREYDKKKYARHARTYDSKVGVVTIPEEDEKLEQPAPAAPHPETSHEEIQWLLLKLGSDLGLSVWIARNDRNRSYNGNSFVSLPRVVSELPRQFDEATNRTIELIDVLWLQGEAIVAAFEVEHTSTIYSGLLRMADLVSMQPNIKLNLYIVAPDDRRDKVFYEINRPTFAKLKPSLPSICKFIPYSDLKEEIQNLGSRIRYVRPEFIEEIAESCEIDEA
jgi:predicted RNA-binding protein